MHGERTLLPTEYLVPASRLRVFSEDGTPGRDIMLYQILQRPPGAERVNYPPSEREDEPAPPRPPQAKIEPLGYSEDGKTPIFSDRAQAIAYYQQYDSARDMAETLAGFAIIQSETTN